MEPTSAPSESSGIGSPGNFRAFAGAVDNGCRKTDVKGLTLPFGLSTETMQGLLDRSGRLFRATRGATKATERPRLRSEVS